MDSMHFVKRMRSNRTSSQDGLCDSDGDASGLCDDDALIVGQSGSVQFIFWDCESSSRIT